MTKLALSLICVGMWLSLVNLTIAGENGHYSVGSVVDKDVTIYSSDGNAHRLSELVRESAKRLNLVFIFGGGGMGHEHTLATGGLWCPDSFEDLQILRSLKADFGEEVGIFPIAIPPAHHTSQLGMTKGVFLNPDAASVEYQKALASFVQTTEAAVESGVIPVKTYYDARYNLLVSAEDLALRSETKNWHGAFRAANETQAYGVPSLWILDQNGKIVREPFRGNVYHPHGGEVLIRYTLDDVVDVLQREIE